MLELKKINKSYTTGTFTQHALNDVSLKFRKSEFVCPKFCNGYPSEIAYSLIEFMQKLRSHYNRAIHINSGLRCRKFNNQLQGSAEESDHLQGLACDFNFENDSCFVDDKWILQDWNTEDCMISEEKLKIWRNKSIDYLRRVINV